MGKHIHMPAMASEPPEAESTKAATHTEPSDTTPEAVYRSITIRNPPHTYLHLTLLTTTVPSSKQPPVDILTARTYLTSALSQFLGLTGTAIPVDFLKVEGRDVWIRTPREDSIAVVGALSQWIGKDWGVSWRVKAKGEWLGAVIAGDGQKLFEP
jgi:ribonuclease P/MRP protein subunit POP8